MESFLSPTVKQWNILPESIRIASGISSFKSLLNSYFCKKGNELFHFGKRKYNIIHCQLRNSANNFVTKVFQIHQCVNTVLILLKMPTITFLHVQNIQILEYKNNYTCMLIACIENALSKNGKGEVSCNVYKTCILFIVNH